MAARVARRWRSSRPSTSRRRRARRSCWVEAQPRGEPAPGFRCPGCVTFPLASGEADLTTPIREVAHQGWRVRLHLSGQVLALDVPDYSWRHHDEDALSPSIPTTTTGFVSAAALLWKGKTFDDGLLAAVSLATQHGIGRFAGKASLLRS